MMCALKCIRRESLNVVSLEAFPAVSWDLLMCSISFGLFCGGDDSVALIWPFVVRLQEFSHLSC